MNQDKSFKYTTERIKYKDFEIQTYTFGTGENVVFSFPSFPHSGLYYILFTQLYDQTKFRFITMDLPGWSGWSENIFKGTQFSMEEYVNLAEYVLDYYKVKRFSLIGYSFGGALAIKLANKRLPDIKNLVLVSTVVNDNLIKNSPEVKKIKLAKVLKQKQRLKGHILKEFSSYKDIATANFGECMLDEYNQMLNRSDVNVIFDSLYELFTSDLTSEIQNLNAIKNILIVSSEDEGAFFTDQSDYICNILKNENTFKIKGSHEDFILRPNKENIKHVLDFLTQETSIWKTLMNTFEELKFMQVKQNQ
jgi:esterase/lipase